MCFLLWAWLDFSLHLGMSLLKIPEELLEWWGVLLGVRDEDAFS